MVELDVPEAQRHPGLCRIPSRIWCRFVVNPRSSDVLYARIQRLLSYAWAASPMPRRGPAGSRRGQKAHLAENSSNVSSGCSLRRGTEVLKLAG